MKPPNLLSRHPPSVRAIFLDDAEPNVVAAARLGMPAITFKNTAQAIRSISDALMAQDDTNTHR